MTEAQQPIRKTPETLRSHRWFGKESMRTFNHRSRMAQIGFGAEEYRGKPVIAILNTWSEINPCHTHFKERAQEVKRGVWQAGGFALEMPAMSLAEPFQKPSALLYRNLLAMEAEELLRSYPVDGVVLMGGCDKTTPGLIMGATSMNLPAIFMPAGPMLRGNAGGKTLGSGSDMFKNWAELRAGTITHDDWEEVLGGIARSPGHCMTMGTASTMTSAAEALGLTLPGAASIPAPDSRHAQMAVQTGRRIVEMVWADLTPAKVLSAEAFDNAVVCVLALGGSTNALVHLVAMARRAGVALDLQRFDALAASTPLIANLRPAGKYLMEDFFCAGGLRGLLERLRPLLHAGALTVNGRTLGDNIAGAPVHDDDVILPVERALVGGGSLAVLRGNLAPNGAVIKPAAAEPHLHRHTGRAVVFDSYAALNAGIDAPDLDIDANSVLVLRNAGPLGGPGMPEWGQLPIPKKLLQQGVRDMVRISDARMSGTSFGACVLHVAPESFVGGPLALVRTGDLIELDIPARKLALLVDDAELECRRAAWTPPPPRYQRGYGVIFAQQVTQADEGCDFALLRGTEPTREPDIF
ncbi:L-arabinonate dehydratase [Cupriavidus sp. CV2]|uniref:L-arabinonate dehydratase n=1 Tax=Cupriavidus ulmosensis TaxID=3065913 RepID=UPI00296B53C3|nr:L-arabinonate dehydratase [Cupriavidus sp. CV2]MDW3682008.1 L-arabinonate dehydratase [Cupriavidus sp. CV2]